MGVWVAAGYALRLDDNAYLLLGIPLTAGFQLLVRRRPLRELYAAGTTRFALSRRGVVVAALLAVVPGYFAVRALMSGQLASSGWYLAAMAGAVAAAFSLRATTLLATLRGAALPIAIGAGGMVAVYGTIHVVTGAPLPTTEALAALATYVALYFPATFLMEEVAFRGAVDAHVHHDGEHRGWWSAVLVSALWGLWHLPVSSDLPLPFPLLVAELVVVHIALGVPLSFAWRRHRNLAAPALAHAVNDAVRNAVMLGL
ncbi:CPBP family intramembrane glutamic endopeptidase [Intrasporangium sp. YIM S08009]|uniref:CPBP family intramembrane glutamic endopeptidase n=1 Tax=Intrasporangium zincisolvens TaxID=3080018 RepID=UPI002B0574D3|nr:CPBP family intramembrane glutamic endopeptidase [Intrasporangium sp. YIM S08009]